MMISLADCVLRISVVDSRMENEELGSEVNL